MTQEARDWMEYATLVVKTKWKKPPIDSFFDINLHFYLKNKQSDSHNYKKLLFDSLEHGGVCTNDKYILDRTINVFYDKENPRVIMEING
jgi:Holliday junction resolvase RusA-like endonuclease